MKVYHVSDIIALVLLPFVNDSLIVAHWVNLLILSLYDSNAA